MDIHELAAGKLATLFSPSSGQRSVRAHQILQRKDLVIDKLRLAFVVYGAMNRKDWRTISFGDISYDIDDLKQK